MKEVTPKAKWRLEGRGGSKRRARWMLLQAEEQCVQRSGDDREPSYLSMAAGSLPSPLGLEVGQLICSLS